MTLMNVLAILAAVVVYQALGAMWYSKLFGKAWMEEVNMKLGDVSKERVTKALIFATLFAISIAIIIFMTIVHTKTTGALHTAGVGFTLAVLHALATATNIAYENKSFRYFAITAGYPLVGWTLMGLVMGLFL